MRQNAYCWSRNYHAEIKNSKFWCNLIYGCLTWARSTSSEPCSNRKRCSISPQVRLARLGWPEIDDLKVRQSTKNKMSFIVFRRQFQPGTSQNFFKFTKYIRRTPLMHRTLPLNAYPPRKVTDLRKNLYIVHEKKKKKNHGTYVEISSTLPDIPYNSTLWYRIHVMLFVYWVIREQ